MAAPTFETLLYDVEDGIATITLNRPDKLNAFTNQMMHDLIAVFDATDADDAVKVVIVTGAGRGIGRGHARFLAGRGAAVVVTDSGAGTDGNGGAAGLFGVAMARRGRWPAARQPRR